MLTRFVGEPVKYHNADYVRKGFPLFHHHHHHLLLSSSPPVSDQGRQAQWGRRRCAEPALVESPAQRRQLRPQDQDQRRHDRGHHDHLWQPGLSPELHVGLLQLLLDVQTSDPGGKSCSFELFHL